MLEPPKTIKPVKSMPVVYVGIGGVEYAAIITDVRPEGVCLMTFPPGTGGSLPVSRVPFRSPMLDSDRPPFCYYALQPSGSDALRK